MKVIGVIGYSGIVGSFTCDYLEQYSIVIKGSRSAVSDGKRYFRVDVDDQNSLCSFCAMCDLVINCAGPSYLMTDKVAKAAALSRIPYIDAFGCGESIELCKSNGGQNIIGAGFIPGISGIIIKELAQIGLGNTSIELYHGGEELGGKAALMDIVKSSLNHYIKPGYCLEDGELKKYNDYDAYEYEEDFDQPIIKKLCFTEEDQQLVNTIGIKNLKDIQVHSNDFALKMIASLCVQDLEGKDDSIYERAIEMQKKHMEGKIPWFCIKGVGTNEDGSEVITIKGNNSSYLTGLTLGICARKVLEMQYRDETKWLFEIVDFDFLSKELQKQGVIIKRYMKTNQMMECGDI